MAMNFLSRLNLLQVQDNALNMTIQEQVCSLRAASAMNNTTAATREQVLTKLEADCHV